MRVPSIYGKLSGAALALALCVNSTAAAAATTVNSARIDPMVAFSAFASDTSRAALCGAAASAAAASAVAGQAAQAPAPGCVLPVVDVPPPAVVETAPPPVAPVVPVAQGFGIPWALLGVLAALAAGALLLDIADDEDDEDEENEAPVPSPS